MDLCLVARRRPGPILAMWWWEQEGMDLEGMLTASQEAEQMDLEEETYRKETDTED